MSDLLPVLRLLGALTTLFSLALLVPAGVSWVQGDGLLGLWLGCAGAAADATMSGFNPGTAENFFLAWSSQVLKSCWLTTRTAIGMKAWLRPHSCEHWP